MSATEQQVEHVDLLELIELIRVLRLVACHAYDDVVFVHRPDTRRRATDKEEVGHVRAFLRRSDVEHHVVGHERQERGGSPVAHLVDLDVDVVGVVVGLQDGLRCASEQPLVEGFLEYRNVTDAYRDAFAVLQSGDVGHTALLRVGLSDE